jgi:hypothetical protein
VRLAILVPPVFYFAVILPPFGSWTDGLFTPILLTGFGPLSFDRMITHLPAAQPTRGQAERAKNVEHRIDNAAMATNKPKAAGNEGKQHHRDDTVLQAVSTTA